MLNTAPDTVFSSLTARQAAAHAIDRERLNAVRGLDIPTIAAGPFGPGSMGFLADSGYPEYDLEKAKALVAQYAQESGTDFSTTLSTTTAPTTAPTGNTRAAQQTEAGIDTN